MNDNWDMQGFPQSSGRTQGGDYWHYSRSNGSNELERSNPIDLSIEYQKVLNRVPISQMITILKYFGYKVYHNGDEK